MVQKRSPSPPDLIASPTVNKRIRVEANGKSASIPSDSEKETFKVLIGGDTFVLTSSQIKNDGESNFFIDAFFGDCIESQHKVMDLPDKSPEIFYFIHQHLKGYHIFPLDRESCPPKMSMKVTLENILLDAIYFALDGLASLTREQLQPKPKLKPLVEYITSASHDEKPLLRIRDFRAIFECPEGEPSITRRAQLTPRWSPSHLSAFRTLLNSNFDEKAISSNIYFHRQHLEDLYECYQEEQYPLFLYDEFNGSSSGTMWDLWFTLAQTHAGNTPTEQAKAFQKLLFETGIKDGGYFPGDSLTFHVREMIVNLVKRYEVPGYYGDVSSSNEDQSKFQLASIQALELESVLRKSASLLSSHS